MELYREQAMPYPHIIHHGAVSGVTNSCHQLQMDPDASLLIGCGLFQGADYSEQSLRDVTSSQINFPLGGIKALVVTHVHADHVGRVPYLLAAGSQGPILCSEPSAKLLPLVLEDAFKLEFSREPKLVECFVKRLKHQLIAVPFDHWFTVSQTPTLHARLRLQRTGYILGSAYAECDLNYPQVNVNRRIVFSDDSGAIKRPFYHHLNLLSVLM